MANDVDASSELSKIAKLNGGFRRNYGTLIGAILYLRTVSAARRSPWLWAGLISIAFSTVLSWLGRHSPHDWPPGISEGSSGAGWPDIIPHPAGRQSPGRSRPSAVSICASSRSISSRSFGPGSISSRSKSTCLRASRFATVDIAPPRVGHLQTTWCLFVTQHGPLNFRNPDHCVTYLNVAKGNLYQPTAVS
jgi:hypothetical protein